MRKSADILVKRWFMLDILMAETDRAWQSSASMSLDTCSEMANCSVVFMSTGAIGPGIGRQAGHRNSGDSVGNVIRSDSIGFKPKVGFPDSPMSAVPRSGRME